MAVYKFAGFIPNQSNVNVYAYAGVVRGTPGDETSITGVRFTGLRPSRLRLIHADISASNIRVSDVILNNSSAVSSLLSYMPGGTPTPTIRDVVIMGDPTITTANIQAMVALPVGSIVSGLQLRNMRWVKASGILGSNAGATFSDITISDIAIGTLGARALITDGTTPSTGTMTNVSVQTYSSVGNFAGTATKPGVHALRFYQRQRSAYRRLLLRGLVTV